MPYEIVFTETALEHYGTLDAHWRATIKSAIATHLLHEPARNSKSRVKRLREMDHPQYRFRVNDYRIFYDIIETEVIIIAIVSNDRHGRLAQPVRHPTTDMITVSISQIKNDFSAYVSQAKNEDVIVTNHGKPVAFIRGFENEDDFLEHRLLNDPRFQEIVEKARSDYRAGRVTRLEDIDK